MISLKVETIGDRTVLVLDDAALAALGAHVGDTLNLDCGPDSAVLLSVREGWLEDTHARGRAFLKRYRRTFDQLPS